ncbi:MAG: hypothetical protein CMC48_07350 [Flavobacteriaceae bacterium]|nr:hypothetical protein [Flavobacteriaceae bacterium]
MSSIYIHIPDVLDLNLKRNIESAILKEIDLRYNEIKKKLVQSIYIKSPKNDFLSSIFLKTLLSRLNKYFSFHNELEITLELDIQNIKIEDLEEISKTKVNRLSCRTYSFFYNNFSSEELYNRFFENIGLISNFYKNYSIDLIFGIPNLSHETLDSFLNKLNENSPLHLTLEEFNYGLNTTFDQYKSVYKSLVIDQYNFYCKKLVDFGYEQYEYLNFSKNGNYSKQNLNYWSRKTYLGLGPSACSYFKELRCKNFSDITKYLIEINKSKKPLKIERLSEKDIYNETIMTGLSISKGLSLLEVRKKFKSFYSYFKVKVKKHLGLGNLNLEKKIIKVNNNNKYFTDQIASDFFKI